METSLQFYNSNGMKLAAVLDNPSREKSAAMFILCHGHGSHKNSKTFISLIKKLQPEKVSTFRFDFHGHGESEGKFEEVTCTQAIDDICSAINFLKKEGYSKIGLVGSSLGALTSIMAAVKYPDVFALALKSPTFDYAPWKARMIRDYGIDWEKSGYITFKTNVVTHKLYNETLDFFAHDATQYNPFAVASHLAMPIFVVNGNADHVTPLDQSKKFLALVMQPHLAIIEGADHEYTTSNTFDQMIEALANFLINVSK